MKYGGAYVETSISPKIVNSEGMIEVLFLMEVLVFEDGHLEVFGAVGSLGVYRS